MKHFSSLNLTKLSFMLCVLVIGIKISFTKKDKFNKQEPTIFVILLVRNKQHSLPYFLTLFENLDYPKNRISLWIRSDHNADKSIDILKVWVRTRQLLYHSVDFNYSEDDSNYYDATHVNSWSEERFNNIIRLKDEGLDMARNMWADFAWFLDCDVFLTNNQTLKYLVAEEVEIIAPMLNSLGMYSNFWCGMTEAYYYVRTPEYEPILNRKNLGIHQVPMVHSCVLIDLHSANSLKLSFKSTSLLEYEGPNDDIIVFARSAKQAGIPMHVLNNRHFGYIPGSLEEHESLEDEKQQILNIKLLALSEGNEFLVSSLMKAHIQYPLADSLSVDQVYLINLARRPERLIKMQTAFKDLGIHYSLIEAVDGKFISDEDLEDMGITLLKDYRDPYSKRPMTKGEIGCFLSHYQIWQKMVHEKHKTIIVFEDDIKFEPYFKQKLSYLFREVDGLNLTWDLIYLGRKRLSLENETWVEDSKILVHVEYSYWTLSYALSLEGARKLLKANPLEKLIPVDEFLPIMFNKHPNSSLIQHFPERKLIAFSASPLLVYPTHYTGDEGYISDTEDSEVMMGDSKGASESMVLSESMKPSVNHYDITIGDKAEL